MLVNSLTTEHYLQNKKYAIGICIILLFSILLLLVPELIGLEISLQLRLVSLVLLCVYVVLSFEMVHRTTIALFGAVTVIVIAIVMGNFQTINGFEQVLGYIDFNTIGLLLGMMIIVAIMSNTGIFQYVGIRAIKTSKGNLWKIMVLLCVFTATVSMFIDNVTTVLLMVPIAISVLRSLSISPIPFIIAMVLASNVGGAATLIGDPPNIMIGSAENIDFNSFLVHMGSTVAVSFITSLLLLRLFFRKELKASINDRDGIMKENENAYLKDINTLKRSIGVLFGVIVLFAFHGILNLEPSIIALGGAAFLLIITRLPPEQVLHEVDWTTLLFFTGLFIIVGFAQQSGLITLLSNLAISITNGNPWFTFLIVIWLSALASAFVDNIPFTATMIPVVHSLNENPIIASTFDSFQISPLWWALSLGANFGGNGTLIGSSAAIIAVGLAEKLHFRITFNQFLKVAFPFMILTVSVGTLMLFIDTLIRL
jgi:Na+/H+ antiporter NhaD/arsenite permease-like protein